MNEKLSEENLEEIFKLNISIKLILEEKSSHSALIALTQNIIEICKYCEITLEELLQFIPQNWETHSNVFKDILPFKKEEK